MLPVAQLLLSQGLGLLGNAVLAKGKNYIEEKLGVDIEAAIETDSGKQNLLQLQSDHEEFLINAALARDKIFLEDVQSAREMAVRINEAPDASWLSKNIVPFLAILVLIGGGLTLYYAPDTEVRMAAVGLMTMVIGYYFGTSASSRSKDQLIGNVVERGTK